ncbi:MAG TPA: PKD domain-containing protein [Urbifossiella sp.]|jgi:PKD repeat protein|nr:PKD domain-containing protein [Urbifossiella sp.]
MAVTCHQTLRNGSARLRFQSENPSPNGPIADAYWDFGDGSPVVDEVASTHTFSTPGTYTVTTTVFDDEGASDTTSASIVVGEKTSDGKFGGTGPGSPPVDTGGQLASGTGSPPAPVTSPKTSHATKHKPLRCHMGFKRKKVHDKDKCV